MDRHQSDQAPHTGAKISNKNPITQQEKTKLLDTNEYIENIPKKDTDTFDSDEIQGRLIKGRYKVETLIGHGGMCDVYRAKDLLLEAAGVKSPFVALKVLQKEYMNQSGAAKILIKEAQKTQQLSHPNIIRVYDFGGDKHAHFLVMEWLDGETLEEVIQRSRPNGLSYDKAMRLLDQVISALRYAHEQGVVHADLKPSNIILTRDGRIKLFDFGVSRALNLNADYYAAETRDETNALSGYTPTYASPDLLKGREPEIKDDIFAFSCIAYELLTSQHPFERKPADIAEKNQLKALKPTNISKTNWRILQSGLAFQSEQRISNFTEMTERLNKRYWPLFATGAATVCIAALIGYGFMMKEERLRHLSAQLEILQSDITANQQLVALPSNKLLEILPVIPQGQQLLISGLLHDKREQILNIYQNKINALLTNRTERYPDYYAIEKEIIAAQSLYPDSLTLNAMSERIANSWTSTIDILVQRINVLLEKGDYQHHESGNDVYQLLGELQQLKSGYTFKPTAKSEEIFTTSLSSATSDLDVAKLQPLLEVGELFFLNTLKLESFASYDQNFKQSVHDMVQYQHQIEQGQTPSFPYQAARTLYESKISAFESLIKQSTTIEQLDNVGGDINLLAQALPDDFIPLNQLRLSMASRYLTFSDQLLKSGKPRTASTVMNKANNLFALVESNRANL
ncbi:protein kinase-like protein [Photobacterium lutimaris]|nr:protein kinase-like protein [Photobacterium lutimaris]